MITKIKGYIEKNNLIIDNKIVICVSTGVDSMVLLDVMHKLDYNIVVCHVNHNVRRQSIEEENFITSYCKERKLILEKTNFYHDNSDNFQKKARDFRYAFFKETASKHHINQILTAHHLDDNFESILMNIVSGSNLLGYSGIANKFQIKDKFIIRPFLCVSKDEIVNYAKVNSIKYFEDESNKDNKYSRNRLRNSIIPSLKMENSNTLYNISNFSTILKSSYEFIRTESSNYLQINNDKIDCNSFNKLHEALRRDIICLLLEKFELDKNYNTIELIDKMIISHKPQQEISLKNNYFFFKRYDTSFISKKDKQVKSTNHLNTIEDVIYIENYKLFFSYAEPKIGANVLKLCYNSLTFPICVRTRESGDVLNLSFGSKKLNRIMIDKKITLEQRDKALIVTTSNNEIIWVHKVIKNVPEKNIINPIYLVIEEKYNDQ
ncbi:MAG: tRNA lysidine(34) synthetase TilS [Anaeroplasmataceae bacterium]